MRGVKLQIDQVVAALATHRGCITTTAASLGVSRTAIQAMAKRSKRVADALYQERERQKDYTESKLFELIDAGNITAIIFYLKCQAKDRGYVERQEITGPGGGSVRVSLGWSEDSGDGVASFDTNS